MWRSVVLVVAFAAVVRGQSTDVSQCISNPGALPIHTYVVGCTTPPCLLPQLQDVVLNIVFRTPSTTRTMTTLVTAYMAVGPITLPIPYPLGENAITCNFLQNTYCPLLENEVVMYELRMHIESTFPVDTSVTLEFRAIDERSSPVFCIRVPIRVGPPLNTKAALTSANATMVNFV